MSKAIIVPDLAYTSHTGRRGNGSSGGKELLATLKYLQYRDDANGHIPQQQGLERWQDRGLGQNYREILNSCHSLSSAKVLAWTWVISPAPDLMALVPQPEREALVKTLTEQIVEAYYEARGVDVPRYSYVMHDRIAKPDDEGNSGLHQLHTHVVLPGTTPTIAGEQLPFYNRANKGHVQLLRDIASESFSAEMDRRVGIEWHELRPELQPTLQPELLLQAALPELPPVVEWDGLSELDRWFGRRIPEREIE